VTVAQALAALDRCNQKLATSHPGVHRDAQPAFARMRIRLRQFPPYGIHGAHLNIARELFTSGRKVYRLDAENMIGHNLQR
jgi:hypothetical protein